MKKILLLQCGLLLICHSLYSQNRKDQFEILSKSVEGEIYPIEVVLPDEYDSTKRYPILYFTDWWFSTQSGPQLYNRMRYAGEMDPIIIVGIGTKGDMDDWRQERLRDFTPTNLPEYDMPDPDENGSRGISGGAGNFLDFIKDELIPLVETKYPSDTLDRGFFGYSLGGLFGAYVLATEPKLFQKYILGSPTLRYDEFVMIERLKETPADLYSSVASIFISIGEEEPGDYLKGFADFRDLMIEKEVPGLEINSYIVIGEGHILSSTPAIIKGLKLLYGNK